jgi:hypothetical protein
MYHLFPRSNGTPKFVAIIARVIQLRETEQSWVIADPERVCSLFLCNRVNRVKNETEKNFTHCAVRYVVQYCVIEGDPNIPDREMIRIEGNPGCFPVCY